MGGNSIFVEKLQLLCSRKLYLLCTETQVTFIFGETTVATQQETLAAMCRTSSYFHLWRNSGCYAAENLSCYARKLKLLLSVEKLQLLCNRKLELLRTETQVASICGETPVAMQQAT
jgi:hypothetical protein